MKKSGLLLLLLSLIIGANAQKEISIIPKPVSVEHHEGRFFINSQVKLHADETFGKEMYYFKKELLRFKKITIAATNEKDEAQILLIKSEQPSGHLYQLEISPNSIHIQSNSDRGIFYGVVSLLQLINKAEETADGLVIPCGTIKDSPEYGWRGIMLDESRHFFGKEKVKSILDWMAYYKLNRFHWHLTDEPGWRIEIQHYPKLGLVGGIGDYTNPYAACTYYSQEDIKEIVAYSLERKIQIIPEIDMPGHATAANRAYPQFSGGGSEKHPEFTFHPGKEGTYQYLTDILKEVDVLFPSQMIHLGGDEVSYGNEKWVHDPEVKDLMEQENLSEMKAIEDYFMRRMSDSLLAMNNSVLAWDEMATAGLPADKSIIFWWRHDQPQQLAKSLENGHKTVICPRLPFYFDFVQKESHRFGRKWGGRFNQLQDVYNFSLDGLPVKESQKELILGYQANLWTETVVNEQRLDFLLFPRIAALAEAVWTRDGAKDYDEFLMRLQPDLKLYRDNGIYFFNPFEPDKHPEPIVH